MPKYMYVCALAFGLAACDRASTLSPTAASPTAPTVTTPSSTAPALTTPSPTPAPPWTLDGPSGCVSPGSAHLLWTLTVNNAGSTGGHIVFATFHDATAGCNPTEAGPFTGLLLGGSRDYSPNSSGVTTFQYDPANTTCGRVQVDVGLNDALVVGMVINYGKDCSPLPPAPTPGPPSASAPPPTDPPSPPSPTPPSPPPLKETCSLDVAQDRHNCHGTARWSGSETFGDLSWGDGHSEGVSNSGRSGHTYAKHGDDRDEETYTITLTTGSCSASKTIRIKKDDD